MNNKLAVMFLTFLVMIAITPFIFGKLMNAKYNQMLDNLRKKGVEINVTEDKSTYLQTDKILSVTIPSKLFDNSKAVKNIKLKVETKFKNLPVTNVIIISEIEDIDISINNEAINAVKDFIKKNIKLTIVTPDFKKYNFKFKDINTKAEDMEFRVSGISGFVKYKNQLYYKLCIKEILLNDTNDTKRFIKITNLTNNFSDKRGIVKSALRLDFKLQDEDKIELKNFKILIQSSGSEYADINTTFVFDDFILENKLKMYNFNLKFNAKHINKADFVAFLLSSGFYKQIFLNSLLSKGVEIDIDSKTKTVIISDKKGYYKLHFYLKTAKSNNLNIQNANLKLTTTKEVFDFVVKNIGFFNDPYKYAKVKNGVVYLDIQRKNNQLYINGKLAK